MSELAIERTDTRVRKWGMLKIGISDYGAATITVPANAPQRSASHV